MKFRKTRVFYNRKSGTGSSLRQVQDAFSEHWKNRTEDLAWYFPTSPEESWAMLDRALEDGTDSIIIGGGDGTVASIGTRLIGTSVCIGVIPLGSGNGLARHFSQSLDPEEAVEQLASATVREMDVGFVNDLPFLVSASAAWDAAIVKAYDRSPLRGVGSYVLAGVYSFFEYVPKPVRIIVDGNEIIDLDRPFLLTIGNLSGWGGGARIARMADGSDGRLEFVAARQQDAAGLLANIAEVFDGGLAKLPRVIFRKFQTLRIERTESQPIQLDGELTEAPKTLEVTVQRAAIRVLVPTGRRELKFQT